MKRQTLVIVSGYFSPLHCGHLDYLEAGAALGDRLVVIVNNNAQQLQKKGKIILDENDRLRIVRALEIVDDACIADDKDDSVKETISVIALANPEYHIIFGNGGDRNEPSNIPEVKICRQHNIDMHFGLGGLSKRDSSTRINKELDAQ